MTNDPASISTPNVSRPGGTNAEIDRVLSWSMEFLADLNTKNLDRILHWFDAETELWIPPAAPRRGAKRIIRFLRVVFSQYQELAWQARTLYVVDPTTVITEVATQGRFSNGRAYENQILTLQHWTLDGRLRRLSDYFKNTQIFSEGAGADSREASLRETL